MNSPHFGIDFDNTIVCYDKAFYKIALEKGLINPSIPQTKTAIRNYLRSCQKESEWTLLQGYVYGARMDLAEPFDGIASFFSTCRKKGIKVSIISHKTKYPYMGPKHDLHAAAVSWLKNQSFYYPDLSFFFELTLKEKLERIHKAACDFFIDDLPEVLNESDFPQKVRKILFDPDKIYSMSSECLNLSSWNQMELILPQLFLS